MWKFQNIYKETIWGGQRIASFKGETLHSDKIGECWELSAVEGSESVVADGIDVGMPISALIDKYGADLLGKKNFARFGNRFPLLIKLIDANDDLSVQVHPNDELARRRGEINGKAEMWYVLSCSDSARLVDGFKNPVTPEEYHDLVKSGEITKHMRLSHIKQGEVYYIPAGRIHAIGSGVMVVEIQQTSDITYRIYDYDRTDASGRKRELHTELAFEAIDFSTDGGVPINFHNRLNFPVNLVTTPHFTTNILQLDSEVMRDYSEWDTFVAIIATQGSATLRSGNLTMKIHAGETILIPANANSLTIHPDGLFTALETYIK